MENLENENVDLTEEIVEEVETEEEPLVENKVEEAPPQNEPGYVQKRVDKAVAKALERERDSIRQEMEAQYAPIKERLLEMDAQELVRKGEVKDIETAKELIRYRQGMPPKQEQPRNPQGQFTSNAKMEAKVEFLAAQADRIKAKTGLDVVSEFENNEDVRQKIINGEMDFYDIAESMKNNKRPPSPTRSPNGASGQINAIDRMTKDEFARLEKRISEGARISLR